MDNFDPDAYLAGGLFDPDAYLNEKADLGTAIKSSFAGVGNMADSALSGLAGGLAGAFGAEDDRDAIFKEMEARKASRSQWANPDNQEIGTGGKLAGIAATLPMQVVAAGLSPAETGQTLLREGEKLGTAFKGAGIDALGNIAGMVLPGFKQGSMAVRGATGFGANSIQDYATKAAIQAMAETEGGKAAFNPTLEDAALAGVVGGVLPMAMGGKASPKSNNPKVNKMLAEQAAVDTPAVIDKTATPADYHATEGLDGQRSLFDIPEEGRMPNPYEAVTGDWRIDENGMPIKADLSMDAQNAAQPLQRNLWGDELAQKLPQENDLNLPQAIDSMPSQPWKGDARDVALDRLKGEIQPSGEMLAAKMAADIAAASGDTIGKGFNSKFQKGQVLVDGKRVIPEIRKTDTGYEAYVDGKKVGYLNSNLTGEQSKMLSETANVDIVKVSDDMKGRGVGSALYKAWSDEHNGNIAPSGKTSKEAWNLWKNKYPEKVDNFVRQEAMRIKAGADRQMVLGNITDPTIAQRVFDASQSKVPFNFKKQGGGLLISPKEKTGLDNALALSDDGTFIPKNPNVQEVVAKSLADGKDGMSNKFTYLQSGATSAAMKAGSPAIKAAAEIVQNAVKRADLAVRNAIFPAEAALKKLSKADITELAEIFKNEMTLGKRFDADVLTKNLSIKQLDAYTHMRDMFDKSLDAQNEARLAKGQDPISPNEAYMASRWSGDFRRPVYDKNGKLVWYLAADTKVGLQAQSRALLKEFPDLVSDASKDHHVKSSIGKTDLQSMYTTMLDVLGRNDPAIEKIRSAIEAQTTAEAEMVRGQEKHFERKANIRGFVGDRPGTNPAKEAVAMFQQQLQYAKNAFTWSEMQKAADDIKGIVSDPDLQAQQPNNVKYIREYFKNAIGHGESRVMRAMDDTLREGLGVSPKVLSEAIGDLKSFFILQKLAASAGFALSNVVQSANVIPYLIDLNSLGYKGNPVKALGVGYPAGTMMALSHYLKAGGGDYLSKIPDQFLRDAVQYAEENGVTARSIYGESPLQASFSKVSQGVNLASKTMTIPETWVRSVAFMTYAQMLKDSGKYSDMSKLFQHAEELVNKSMVDYRETEKPLMFSKGGSIGNFLNTLQTYPMSFYNQYSYMTSKALKGNPAPLLAMGALQVAISGAMGVPYAEDVYKMFSYIKDNLVSTSTWKDMKDSKFLSDPKLWTMETLGNGALYGALSDMSGLGMTSRVAAPSVGGMLQSPVGPIADIAKQVGSVGSAVMDPTNSTKWAQAAMDTVPVGLAGLLETSGIMKDHTYIVKPDGTKVFMKTSDLAKRDASVERSEDEVGIRKFGLRSQREVVEKDVKYITDNTNSVANKKSAELIEKFYDASRQGNTKRAGELNSLYKRLTGKEITNEQYNKQAKQEYLTGFQKSADKQNMTPQEAINFARMVKILENSK